MLDYTTGLDPNWPRRTIDDVMREQSPIGSDGWVCPQCQNHQGGITCSKGIMICWVGANMLGCCCFVRERRKGV